MKKIILICAASMYAFGLFAQTDSTKGMKHDMDNNKMDKSMYHQTTDKSQPDGVRMQKGKMMVGKNNNTIPTSREYKLKMRRLLFILFIITQINCKTKWF